MEGQAAGHAAQVSRNILPTGALDIICEICDARFKYDRNWQQHFYKMHGKNGVILLNQSFYKQCECYKVFTGDYGLQKHCQQSGHDGVGVHAGAIPPAMNGNEQNNNNNNHQGHVDGNGDGEENEAIVDAAAAAVAERAQMLSALRESEEAMKELRGALKEALYLVNHNWKSELKSITNKLLTGMNGEDERKVLDNMLAFKILPGLLRVTGRLNLGRPIDLLRRIDASDNAAEATLIEGIRAKRAIAAQGLEQHHPRGAANGLIKAANDMGDRARLSAADRFVEQAQEVLTGNNERVAHQQPLPASEAKTIIGRLFPTKESRNRPDLDDLPPIEDAPVGLVATGEDVRAGIKNLSKDAAPGASGWTNHVLKLLGSHGDEAQQTAFSGLVAQVFNRIYAGTMPTCCQWLWTDSRAVLIPKPNGSYRPLGIGDAWYRLLVRIAYHKHNAHIGAALAPEGQLAVGVPGGCEIGARIAQLHLRQENPRPDDWEFEPAIVCVDVANCFNECPAARTLDGLRELAPELARLYIWTHNHASDLVYSDGTVVGHREIGEGQGCPGSSPNGSLALRALYRRLAEVTREVEIAFLQGKGMSEEAFRQRGHGLSFIDDWNGLVCLGVAVRLAPLIPGVYAEFGMRCEESKGAIVCTRAQEAFDAGAWPARWGRKSDGVKILGAPTGTDVYVQSFLENELAVIRNPPLNAFKMIHKRLALQLATMVRNTRYDYLLRVVEPRLTNSFAEKLDKMGDKLLAVVADTGEDLSRRAKTLRGLPVKLGGMGMYTHGSRREAGAVNSRARTLAFLREHWAGLTATAENPDIWPEVIVGASDGLPDGYENLTAEEQGHLASRLEPKKVEAATRRMVMQVEEKLLQNIIDELLDNQTLKGKNTAAYLLSCKSKASGLWIKSTHAFASGIKDGRALADSVCTQIVRARLLEPQRDSIGRVIENCPCCWNPHTASNEGRAIGPSHALGCRYFKKGYAFTNRHNAVRDELAHALKKHLPLTGLVVEREVPLHRVIPGYVGNPDKKPVMDIVVRADDGFVRYIDVSVVEPSGSWMVGQGSWEQPLRAAEKKEEKKIGWYRSAAPDMNQNNFIPFIFESSGRPGKRAKEYLMASGLPGAVTRSLLGQISLKLAHFGGMQMSTLARFRAG